MVVARIGCDARIARVPMPGRRDRVESPGMERMTLAEPPDRQPASASRSVHPHRLEGVRAARRVEPAARRQQRADQRPVEPDQPHQSTRQRRRPPDRVPGRFCCLFHTAPPCRRSSARITEPRSAAKSAWLAVAAGGLARNTTRLPRGRECRYPATRWRSRLRTRFRTTAGPTARLTMNPTRAGSSQSGRTTRWPTTQVRPTRRPRRTAAVNSVRRRIRAAGGNIPPHRRASRGRQLRR